MPPLVGLKIAQCSLPPRDGMSNWLSMQAGGQGWGGAAWWASFPGSPVHSHCICISDWCLYSQRLLPFSQMHFPYCLLALTDAVLSQAVWSTVTHKENGMCPFKIICRFYNVPAVLLSRYLQSNVDNHLLINVRKRSSLFLFWGKRDMLSFTFSFFNSLFAQKTDVNKKSGDKHFWWGC